MHRDSINALNALIAILAIIVLIAKATSWFAVVAKEKVEMFAATGPTCDSINATVFGDGHEHEQVAIMTVKMRIQIYNIRKSTAIQGTPSSVCDTKGVGYANCRFMSAITIPIGCQRAVEGGWKPNTFIRSCQERTFAKSCGTFFKLTMPCKRKEDMIMYRRGLGGYSEGGTILYALHPIVNNPTQRWPGFYELSLDTTAFTEYNYAPNNGLITSANIDLTQQAVDSLLDAATLISSNESVSIYEMPCTVLHIDNRNTANCSNNNVIIAELRVERLSTQQSWIHCLDNIDGEKYYYDYEPYGKGPIP
jgi:hypothetical protein